MTFRLEKDSLGEKQVPIDAYYGIQSLRASENFPVSGLKVHRELVRAYAMLKKAAAIANVEIKSLDEERGRAIVEAAGEILSGRLLDHFIVDAYQAGAGTSMNMNTNEVLANRGLELLGRPKGDYKFLSPNDHVNMAQSTNDTFPTAMHLAILAAWKGLEPVLLKFEEALLRKGEEFKEIIKSGRTHLQDAVPITLGQEFIAYGTAIRKVRGLLKNAESLLCELALGGTAVGTGMNASLAYRSAALKKLSDFTGWSLKAPDDPRMALQTQIAATVFSGLLKVLALELTRIANDFRLLASGPETGFGEIILPAVQPGSSIMPGKVNPSMPECLNMVAFQVIGNDTVVTMAQQAGQLELNVMAPVMAQNILHSCDLLTNYLPVFTDKCLSGIVANKEKCHWYFYHSTSLATLLNTSIGYLKAAELVKESVKTGKPFGELVVEKGLLTKEQVAELLQPHRVTGYLDHQS